jgi:hypothetical protein
MSSDTYTIRVNQFTNGTTGHVNITYMSSNGTYVTYGNNLSPTSGVQVETTQTLQRISGNPGAYSYVDIQVSAQQFSSSLVAAQAAAILNSSYFGLCNNCADFANEALKMAGQGDWSLASKLKDGTLTDTYIKSAEYMCSNEYVNVATSSIMNILASPQNVLEAAQFVEAMQWLSHPTNSEFYTQLQDPDAEADFWLAKLTSTAKKLHISVNFDPIEQKVSLGVASPIVLDMNGDGIRTTAYATGSVMFDIDGDGDLDRTAWISSGDAFLAIDRNGNGVVDGVGELFGGMVRGQGYAKLSEFDDNGDGVITVDDAGYQLLSVWQDANSNGTTEDGELKAVSTTGVSKLYLSYVSQDLYDVNNNLIGEVSSAAINGQSTDMADVYFRYKEASPEQIATVDQRSPACDASPVGAHISLESPYGCRGALSDLFDGSVGNEGNKHIRGTDSVTINNWYGGASYQVELIQAAGDGKALSSSKVDLLVSTMASFAPPAPGQTALTSSQSSAVAAAWV